jgi:hypothetical protein
LLVHHVGDQCNATPHSGAARLSDKYPLITVAGGSPPQSGPCDPLSAHGFFGKESETVEQIVNWMLKKPFRQEVKQRLAWLLSRLSRLTELKFSASADNSIDALMGNTPVAKRH